MKTTENKLQTKAIEHARKLGVPSIRMAFQPGVARGWPDVLFLPPGGIILFVEFKREGEEPTALQQQHIDLLRRLGYFAFVVDNFDEFRNILSRHLVFSEMADEMAQEAMKQMSDD